MTVFWDSVRPSVEEINWNFRAAYYWLLSTSETSVDFYENTRHSISEECYLEPKIVYKMKL
jgi:hypothetical protein